MTMIMIDKAVVEQALAEMERHQIFKRFVESIAALREALAQPQQPLSEEEIQQLKLDCGYGYYSSYEVSAAFIHGVKECEAAHGITKENA